MDHVENKRIYSEMHDAKVFNRNRLDEIEEIRRKYVNKLGKDCPAKKDEFLGLFSNSKLEKLHIKEKKTLCLLLFWVFIYLSWSVEVTACITSAPETTHPKTEIIIPIPIV